VNKKPTYEDLERRIRKLEEESIRSKRLEQEMATLAEIGRLIGSTLNIEEVYERFAAETQKLIRFDSLTINLYHFRENLIHVAYVSGADIDGRRQGDPLVLKGSLSEEVIRTRTGHLIQPENIDETLERFPRLSIIFQAGLRSIICVPLVYRDEVIGVLHFRSKKPNAYTEKDLRLAEKIVTQIAGAVANATLFAERKQAEEALRESQSFYHSLVEQLPAGIFRKDSEGRYVFVSSWFCRLKGMKKEDFLGKTPLEVAAVEAAKPDAVDQAIKYASEGADHHVRIMQTGNPIKLVEEYTDGAGRKQFIHVIKFPVFNSEGKVIGTQGGLFDITERKLAEEASRRNEEKFKTLFMSMTEGFYLSEVIYDKDGDACDYRYVEVNSAFARILGLRRDQIIGKRYKELVPVDTTRWLDVYGDVARTGTPQTFEFYSPEYKKHFETYSYRPIEGQVTVIVMDITERKTAEMERQKLQAQLNQAQKMESVGRLAGGVAHDFNNMLGVIFGHVEMAMYKVDPDHPLFADLQGIQKAAKRSADLTRQLLAFARKQIIAPKVLDLNETVEGMLKMLRRLIGEDIDLAWLPGAGLLPVKVDPSQIDQVLANLCVNSRDAVAGVGKITIETADVTFDTEYCANNPGVSPGDYVLLAVSDNGCGMDKEIRDKLFEPFFTTKEVGKGTGLGLSTVYGIVKQNSGFINVYSEPGRGTTIKIYLPRHKGMAEQVQQEGPAEPVVRGHETILLVEDDPDMLAMTTMLLQRQGYTVLAASRPSEAMRLAEKHAGEIHLLMTDIVMPEMNGLDLAGKLSPLFPNLKQLFVSGYTANVIAHHGILEEGVHFLQKPFSQKDLAIKIRETLG
jgi:PAS domain S-box-containing protein